MGCCCFPTQVKLLYGPMLAIVTASKKSFEAMIRQNSPDGKPGAFATAIYTNPQGLEAQTYRMWMKEVMCLIPVRCLAPHQRPSAMGIMSSGGAEANTRARLLLTPLLLPQVLQPLNEKAAKVLTENADLLETDDMEPLLLQLISHVYANRVRELRCKHD